MSAPSNELLRSIYDLLVRDGVAHANQREQFLANFPTQGEFKFFPARKLERGGKIIRSPHGVRVTTDAHDREVGLFSDEINKQICKLESSA